MHLKRVFLGFNAHLPQVKRITLDPICVECRKNLLARYE